MKLSDLVAYLNLLQSSDLDFDRHKAMNGLDKIKYLLEHTIVQIDQPGQDLCNQIDLIKKEFEIAENLLSTLIQHVKTQIAKQEVEIYQQSQQLYEQEMCFETNEYILNRKLTIETSSKILLNARLIQYTDWRVPGLIIRPGLEKFIESLVPLDPLYLVDQHDELLTNALDGFTLEYQRRLRPYIINDYENQDPLCHLPAKQFGLIFAYNYLNYKPLPVFKNYLTGMYNLLRPGGVAIFTFNDCDWADAVVLAEDNFMCYTPGSKIREFCKQLGFDILSYTQNKNDVYWMEIQKPGEIESIRGGQSLAKIVAIN